MKTLIWALSSCFFACATPLTAWACRVEKPFEPKVVWYADVVVIGRVANYRMANGYARFDIVVDRSLKGIPPAKIPATWDNSTFAYPDTMPSTRFLIALRSSAPVRAMPNGQTASVIQNPLPGVMTVLQEVCAQPFLLPGNSKDAADVRAALEAQSASAR
jgi:hypothetical protein